MTKLDDPLLAPGLVVWLQSLGLLQFDAPAGPLTWLVNMVRRIVKPDPIGGRPCMRVAQAA